MKREHTACEFKMDPSLPVLLVAERADSYGFYLCKAQHLSEQDKQRFSDDWKERILHPVSEEVELKHMHCEDFYSVVQPVNMRELFSLQQPGIFNQPGTVGPAAGY